MGSSNAVLSGPAGPQNKLGFNKEDVDSLLGRFNLLASARNPQADLVQKDDTKQKVSKEIVKSVTTAVRKRENEILLRRTQPGDAQTRLLQNVSRL